MAQHTRIVVGAASVDVALHMTSGSPSTVKHDTLRIEQEVTEKHIEADPHAVEPGDPFGEEVSDSPLPKPLARPTTKVLQGVQLESGFVDLTERLRQIDEDTHLNGITVEATVPRESVPWERARGSYYIAPTSPEAAHFLAHVWHGLRPTGLAALARFTKRTGHYLGAIIAYPENGRHLLMLIELEWQANMKPTPETCFLDVGAVPESGSEKAIEAMVALRQERSAFADMRDERAGQRAELLTAVREGKKWTAPKPQENPVAEDFGDALLDAVR